MQNKTSSNAVSETISPGGNPLPVPSLFGWMGPNEVTTTFPTVSRDFPAFPNISHSQVAVNQRPSRKRGFGKTLENISAEQRFKLFELLADHTYEEVAELLALDPPDGFGIEVGKSTIGRFYKAHFREIDSLRQANIINRATGILDSPDSSDVRSALRDSYSHLLLERLFELLSRPVQSADELKKLTVIAEKMKNLDRDKELLEEFREQQRREKFAELFAPKPKSDTPPA